MVKNLKKLRIKKGVSQQYLADVIGASQQSINKYENHRSEPQIAVLADLADYFETSVDYLIGHSDIDRKIENTHPFDLNNEEARLIEMYRTLSTNERKSIQFIMENYQKK